MEKSCAQNELFFVPNYALSLGFGQFRGGAPGLVDDPLRNIAVNPAFLCWQDLAGSSVYGDFRITPTVEPPQGYLWPARGLALYPDFVPSPRFCVETRRLPDSLLSRAMLTRPVGRKLSFGLTHQEWLPDRPCHANPQGTYLERVGFSCAGSRTAEESGIPLADRYKGTDQMHEAGHFFSALAAFQLLSRLSGEHRANVTLFARDGSFGSPSSWEGVPEYQPLWRREERRKQEYGHWDFAAGISFQASALLELALSIGHLEGKAVQTPTRNDISFCYCRHLSSSESHRNNQGEAIVQHWDYQGKTLYGRLTPCAQLRPLQWLVCSCTSPGHHADFTDNSTASDSSLGSYLYSADTRSSWGQNEWTLSDLRTDTRDSPLLDHRGVMAAQWPLARELRLDRCFIVQRRRRNMPTAERVSATRCNDYDSFSNGNPEWGYGERVAESKVLHLDFYVCQSSRQISLLLSWTAKSLEFLLGLNRSMTRRDAMDLTTAIFEFREKTSNAVTRRKQRSGEQRFELGERRSEASLSGHPADGRVASWRDPALPALPLAPDSRRSYGG